MEGCLQRQDGRKDTELIVPGSPVLLAELELCNSVSGTVVAGGIAAYGPADRFFSGRIAVAPRGRLAKLWR